jgi:hypothetical protein
MTWELLLKMLDAFYLEGLKDFQTLEWPAAMRRDPYLEQRCH